MALKIGDELIYSTSGDILEVIIRDSSYTPYFKASAPLRDKKKVKKLLDELRDKGVSFNFHSWFE